MMQIERNQLLTVLSESLDCIEKEVFGATGHHAKRVAWLCVQMGRKASLSEEDVEELAVAALLHDNALNAYKSDYHNRRLKPEVSGQEHCILGEENLQLVPGFEVSKGFVKYHHECADGSGPFKMVAEQTPLGAQLIHIADEVDVRFALGSCTSEDCVEIDSFVKESIGILFAREVAELFLTCLSDANLEQIADENIEKLTLDTKALIVNAHRGIAEIFARVIDYKSPFTKNHSLGLAQKTEIMAKHMGYDDVSIDKLYMAAALHDIGKLFVDVEILEKPGRLDEAEYRHIQSHAYETYRLLSKINGFDEIRNWASYHHEKLNGTGYPFGKCGEEMNREERLLACLDIYQALTEDRPYKAGMPHAKAVAILQELVGKGELDEAIIAKINQVFADGSNAETIAAVALFQCPVCGYLYEGDVVPKGYECPVCGVADYKFYRIQ